MPASKQSGRGEVGSMDGWGQTLDYILHTRLEFNLPQEIVSCQRFFSKVLSVYLRKLRGKGPRCVLLLTYI